MLNISLLGTSFHPGLINSIRGYPGNAHRTDCLAHSMRASRCAFDKSLISRYGSYLYLIRLTPDAAREAE